MTAKDQSVPGCIHLRPPAKLNRFLHIVGRRPDGYHLLQTAFELIDWCDELSVCGRDDDQIVLTGGTTGVAAEADLSVRAARALREAAGIAAGCTISLHKHIPQGAGLGGGSADAAAVLLALNQIWALHWELPQLATVGAKLGADVPVFLAQQPAFAEGIGEQLRCLPLVPRRYLVIYPGVALPTAQMFSDPQLQRGLAPITLDDYLAGCPTSNVFQPVAAARSPAVAAALAWLDARIGGARLTGSGSAVYAQIDQIESATAHLTELPADWIARIVNSCANWFDKAEAQR